MKSLTCSRFDSPLDTSWCSNHVLMVREKVESMFVWEPFSNRILLWSSKPLKCTFMYAFRAHCKLQVGDFRKKKTNSTCSRFDSLLDTSSRSNHVLMVREKVEIMFLWVPFSNRILLRSPKPFKCTILYAFIAQCK